MYVLTSLTSQEMNQVTSVASDVTWGLSLIDWFSMLKNTMPVLCHSHDFVARDLYFFISFSLY